MNKFNKFHNHPFHMVTPSPWPLLTSLSLMMMLMSSIFWINELSMKLLIFSMISLIFNALMWWRDVTRESTLQGSHTKMIVSLMKMGMLLFIVSEIFFFISFFWAFFHMSLSPSIELGNLWPPKSIIMFNPYNVPLLNTIILLSSGLTITWSHYSILNNNKSDSLTSLSLTIFLGIFFTSLQYLEYKESMFSMADSVYGSTFFLITGFHGIHVMIGTIFITISTFRLYNNQFSSFHHFGFEASSWYWHFVDVIWLLVYIFLYWWNY